MGFINPERRFILPGKDAVWRLVRDLNPEGEPVSDPHRLHLLGLGVQDADPKCRLSLGN